MENNIVNRMTLFSLFLKFLIQRATFQKNCIQITISVLNVQKCFIFVANLVTRVCRYYSWVIILSHGFHKGIHQFY